VSKTDIIIATSQRHNKGGLRRLIMIPV